MEIKLNRYSSDSEYVELYKQEVGFVFGIESEDYEIVMNRIYDKCHTIGILDEFEVYPINPGTDLYTMYGQGHSIITQKKILE